MSYHPVYNLSEDDFLQVPEKKVPPFIAPSNINIFTMNLNVSMLGLNGIIDLTFLHDELKANIENYPFILTMKGASKNRKGGSFGTQLSIVLNKNMLDESLPNVEEKTTKKRTTNGKDTQKKINVKIFENGNITIVGCRNFRDASYSTSIVKHIMNSLVTECKYAHPTQPDSSIVVRRNAIIGRQEDSLCSAANLKFSPFTINNMNGNFHYDFNLNLRNLESCFTKFNDNLHIFTQLKGIQTLTIHYYIQPKVKNIQELYTLFDGTGLHQNVIERILSFEPIPLSPQDKRKVTIRISQTGSVEFSGLRSYKMRDTAYKFVCDVVKANYENVYN